MMFFWSWVVGVVRRAVVVPVVGVLLVVGLLWCCGSAFALNPERHYELVSPPYKGGYDVAPNAIQAVAPGGDSVAFLSQGSFEGQPTSAIDNSYVASRGAAGWSSVPVDPPSSLAPQNAESFGVADFSLDLRTVLALGNLGPDAGYTTVESPEKVFLLHRTDTADVQENWSAVGPVEPLSKRSFTVGYEGASPDLCHVVFDQESEQQVQSGSGIALVPEAVGTRSELYDLATGCSGESGLGLVGLDNSHKVINRACPEFLGGFGESSTDSSRGSVFNAIADGGGEIFFTAFAGPGARNEAGCGLSIAPVASNPAQVFVRLGGSRTVEVSRPLSSVCGEVPCGGAASRAPALFWGASEDGSRVFFTTTSQLVGEDKGTSNDLYMARIGCPALESGCGVAGREVTSLVQVSHAPSGEPAEVQGVVRVAPDGSRVYFVARGVLGEGPDAEGQAPVKGADNLYVYSDESGNESGKTAFIGSLCSGPEASGVVVDARCPTDLQHEGFGASRNDTNLWKSTPAAREAQTAGPDGRFLVFSTYGRLIGHGPQADTDDAKDVYRYDAVTGALDRVSLGEGGADANGNCNDGSAGEACDALLNSSNNNTTSGYAQHGLGTRAVSEDGSRIVFQTVAPLSPAASNGVSDIYEWHEAPGWSEGRVSLVSDGRSTVPEIDAVMSASGDDIFFQTAQGLVAQDTDGQGDVYDARLGEGFAAVPAGAAACAGDACQGPLTNPAPLLVPGSVSQAPGGDFAAPAPAPAVVKAKGKAAPKCSKGKRLSRGRCVKVKRKARAKKSSHEQRTAGR
jgi:hypothetical protein